jgi:hypothetical protein
MKMEMQMATTSAFFGTALIVLVLWEGFETIVLPRRVTRRFRLTRLYYRRTWRLWLVMVRHFLPARQRETWLSFYGPLSLIFLLCLWAGGLISGFALLHWAIGSPLVTHDGSAGFLTDLYLSGTTFFTLGLGDVIPHSNLARLLVVVESGMGFAFLALVIGYLPALNQTFARREVSISLLDARAGSPPTASEMLRRHSSDHAMEALRLLLHEWERWSAEFFEGHLSYPVLAYFRSQHDNQSWLAALTAILDTCTLVMVGLEGACARQAELTFAMARHAVVDLSIIFQREQRESKHDRLPPAELAALRSAMKDAGLKLSEGEAADRKLAELRGTYEPNIISLAAFFNVSVPPWLAAEGRTDNWQASAWGRRSPKLKIGAEIARKDHF